MPQGLTSSCQRTPSPQYRRLKIPPSTPLPLFSLIPIVGHQRHRASDLQVTQAPHRPPDPRPPHHPHRFSPRSARRSAPLRGQSVCRMWAGVPPLLWWSAASPPQATCGGGRCLTRHTQDVRVHLGGVPSWRLQWTRGKSIGTVLPTFHQMRPEVARNAVVAS
jgi:hypothetical protein